LGPAEQVARPGQYVAQEIAGYPIFVARAPDGQLWAYNNLCPHRGGPIVWPGHGTTTNLTCKYHGWSFAWEGACVAARDFGASEDFWPEDQRLRSISVSTWAHWLWVTLDPVAPPLEVSLGGFAGLAQRYPLERLSYNLRKSRTVACNWKTYVDNHLEGYHIAMVHPSLAGQLDMATYRVDVYENSFCVHTVTARPGSPVLGQWIFRYPNLMVNLYRNGLVVETLMPLAPDRTEIFQDFYLLDGGPGADEMFDLATAVLDENQAVCEFVQRNLAAGLFDSAPLSPLHEGALDWFHRKLKGALTVEGS
jgi:choline monooxygenase